MSCEGYFKSRCKCGCEYKTRALIGEIAWSVEATFKLCPKCGSLCDAIQFIETTNGEDEEGKWEIIDDGDREEIAHALENLIYHEGEGAKFCKEVLIPLRVGVSLFWKRFE